MISSKIKKRLCVTLVVPAFLAVIVVGIRSWGPAGDGVLGSLRLPDGSEYAIVQRFNWSFEPYTVSFYMRPAGSTWGWCYIDHEASRWRDVLVTYDRASDSVVVTERGTRRAVLDRKRRAFWIDNARFSREVPAPQQPAPDFAIR